MLTKHSLVTWQVTLTFWKWIYVYCKPARTNNSSINLHCCKVWSMYYGKRFKTKEDSSIANCARHKEVFRQIIDHVHNKIYPLQAIACVQNSTLSSVTHTNKETLVTYAPWPSLSPQFEKSRNYFNGERRIRNQFKFQNGK